MRTTRHGPAVRGFTLIELMAVVFIVALLVQAVLFNMGALIPTTLLESEANKFIASYDYLRSEAKVQGKRYKLQVDLSKNRWRTVIPPEDRLLSTQVQPEEMPLEWTMLDERLRYSTYCVAGGQVARQGIVDITIDENGGSADQTLSFRLKEDEEKLWTVQIRGLTGQSTLVKSENHQEAHFVAVTEGHF